MGVAIEACKRNDGGDHGIILLWLRQEMALEAYERWTQLVGGAWEEIVPYSPDYYCRIQKQSTLWTS